MDLMSWIRRPRKQSLLKVRPQVVREAFKLFTLFIPSHDRYNKDLGPAKQAHWVEQALKLVATEFEGGTAFPTLKGVFKGEKELLFDTPVIVESCALIPQIMEQEVTTRIANVAAEIKTDTNQECVLFLIDNIRHWVK